MTQDTVTQEEKILEPSASDALNFQGAVIPFSDLEEKLENASSREARLEIMQAAYEHLCTLENQENRLPPKAPKSDETSASLWTKIKTGLAWTGFGLIILATMAIGSVGVFIGSTQMLATFANITGPVSIAISSFLVLLEGILFISFEAAFLKEMMGVNTVNAAHAWLDFDEKELILTQKFNSKISSLIEYAEDKNSLNQVTPFLGIASALNNRVHHIKKKYNKEYVEPAKQKIFRITVTALGAALQVVGGFFSMNAILTGISVGLIGTPLGWAITGIGITAFLMMFLAMRGKGMVNLMNPGMKKFNTLKEKMHAFRDIKKILVPAFHKEHQYHSVIDFPVIHKNRVNQEIARKNPIPDDENLHVAVNNDTPQLNGFTLFQASCSKHQTPHPNLPAAANPANTM